MTQPLETLTWARLIEPAHIRGGNSPAQPTPPSSSPSHSKTATQDPPTLPEGPETPDIPPPPQ